MTVPPRHPSTELVGEAAHPELGRSKDFPRKPPLNVNMLRADIAEVIEVLPRPFGHGESLAAATTTPAEGCASRPKAALSGGALLSLGSAPGGAVRSRRHLERSKSRAFSAVTHIAPKPPLPCKAALATSSDSRLPC